MVLIYESWTPTRSTGKASGMGRGRDLDPDTSWSKEDESEKVRFHQTLELWRAMPPASNSKWNTKGQRRPTESWVTQG